MASGGDDMKQRLVALDGLRALTVVAMVFGHVLIWGHAAGPHAALDAVSRLFDSFRMPMLMLVSGYLAHSLLSRPIASTVERGIHLAWIHMIWLTPLLLLSPFGNEWSLPNYVGNLSRPMTSLWFLWVLGLFTLSVPFARLAPRAVVLAAALGLGMVSFAELLPLRTYSFQNAAIYTLMVYAGLLYRPEIERALTADISWPLPARLIGVAAIAVLAAKVLRDASGHDLLGGVQRLALCVAALYAMRVILDRVAGMARLARLGRNTLPIYVLHVPLMMIVRDPVASVVGPLAPVARTIVLIAGALLLHAVAQRAKLSRLFARPRWLAAAGNRLMTAEALAWSLGGRSARSGPRRGDIRKGLHRHDPALDRHDTRRRALWQVRTGRWPASVADPHPTATLAQFGVHDHDLADHPGRPVVQARVALDRIVAIPASADQHRHHAPHGEGGDLRDRRQVGQHIAGERGDRRRDRQEDQEYAWHQQFRDAQHQRRRQPGRSAEPVFHA